MRLLLFNLATDADDPILGFTTRWIAALARRLEFLHVLTMRVGRIEVARNVRVYSAGKEKGYSEPRRAAEFYRHLFRILRQDRIDACFSHMIPIFTVLAGPVLRAKGIPLVTWHAHPSLSPTLKLAHYLSDRMVASLATAYPYKHDKLSVIGQGIDTDLFAPDGTRPDSPPMILCAGRLSPVKDHLTLLRAAALLRERGQAFRVVILGSAAVPGGEEHVRSLRAFVSEHGMQEVVSFEPARTQQELALWYRRSTVSVNLTPTGFGDKTALEAMSCARPCLVANEGFRETLGEYATRLLFRAGDSVALAECLHGVLAQSETARAECGAYLRGQVVRLHSLDGLAERLVQVLRSVRTQRAVGVKAAPDQI